MDPNKKINRLSLSQFSLLIYKTQIGIGVLTLPREISKTAPSLDGILSILITYLITLGVGYLIIITLKKHPGKTLFDILPIYFGKWFGKLITIIWILYTLYVASIVIFVTIKVINVWILPNTENYILMILFVIPIIMVVKNGLRIMGLFAQFVFLFSIWQPIALLFSLQDAEWLNLLPFFQEGVGPLLKTIPTTFLPFYGFELMFVIYPYLQPQKKAFKGFLIANTLTLNINLIATIICFLQFDKLELTQSIWPTITLMKLIRFQFLERLEVIFLSFYLYVLFVTVITYLYTATIGMKKLLNRPSHTTFVYVIIFIWTLTAIIYNPSSKDLEALDSIFESLNLYMVIYFTTAFWLYTILIQKWKGVESK